MSTPENFAEHNVIATFDAPDEARSALSKLQNEGLGAAGMSYLSRSDEATLARAKGESEAIDMPAEVGKDVVAGGAAGSAGGAATGFLAGAAAFGIPGVGPAVGAGVWATTLGGAAAGATAGGLIGGIRKSWEARYRDAVSEGRVLVGFHSDDQGEVELAAHVLRNAGARTLDRLDSKGQPVTS
jgi:hypothetical protein